MEESVLAKVRPLHYYEKFPNAVSGSLIAYSIISFLTLFICIELMIYFKDELFYWVFLGWRELPGLAGHISKYLLPVN